MYANFILYLGIRYGSKACKYSLDLILDLYFVLRYFILLWFIQYCDLLKRIPIMTNLNGTECINGEKKFYELHVFAFPPQSMFDQLEAQVHTGVPRYKKVHNNTHNVHDRLQHQHQSIANI